MCDDGSVGYDGALTLACGQSSSHSWRQFLYQSPLCGQPPPWQPPLQMSTQPWWLPPGHCGLSVRPYLARSKRSEGQAPAGVPGHAPQAALM